MKKLLKFAVFVAVVFTIQFLCRKATDDFAVELIKAPLIQAGSLKNKEIQSILEQPFHYLGSGGQCYAFASEDGQYVLKVFKQHHLHLPTFVAKVVPDFVKEKFQRKKRELLVSCKIAANELSRETGVIYLHLDNEEGVPNYIHLIDKIKISHHIPSSHLPFVLQKRAVPFFQRLEALEESQAKSAIDALVRLVERRCEKGIGDVDPFLDRNFGFIGNEIVEFDIGPFSYDPMLKFPEHKRREMYFELCAFQRRLCKKHPELSLHLQDHLDKLLHE